MNQISNDEYLFLNIAIAVAKGEPLVIHTDGMDIDARKYTLITLTLSPIDNLSSYDEIFQNYCMRINENVEDATNADDTSTLYLTNKVGIRRINYTTFDMDNNTIAHGILQGFVDERGIYGIQLVIKKFEEISSENVLSFLMGTQLKKSLHLSELSTDVVRDSILSNVAHVKALHRVSEDADEMDNLLNTLKNNEKIRIDEILRDRHQELIYDPERKMLCFNVSTNDLDYIYDLQQELLRRYKRNHHYAPETQAFEVIITDAKRDYPPLNFNIVFPPIPYKKDTLYQIEIYGIGYTGDDPNGIFNGVDILKYFLYKCFHTNRYSRFSLIDRVHVTPNALRFP